MQSRGTGGYFHPAEVYQKIIFVTVATICITPWISPPIGLLLGITITQLTGHPFLHLNHKLTHILLQASVVGLGFGMNLHSALQAGRQGILLTVGSISITLIIGLWLGRLFKTSKPVSFLVAAGTAICGGSAIAALSPVIRAEEKQVSVSLAIVFMLNAVALFVFPVIGHALQLSSSQFGLWCAVAIHDTSSVVGAAGRFDATALDVAVTVKLARALWIIPVALGASLFLKNGGDKLKIPWFIGLFVIAIVAGTYIPVIHSAAEYINGFARAGLTLTLFLIGSGLSSDAVRSVGIKPFLQGLILWIAVSVITLFLIMQR